eukprot:2539134-Pyramimonas_sp.AAC.1
MPANLKQIARLVFTSAYPTASKLHSWGFKLDPLCLHCRQRDTVWHRVWRCPQYAAQGAEMLEPEEIELGLEAGDNSLLFNELWAPRPSAETVPPKDELPQYVDSDCKP